MTKMQKCGAGDTWSGAEKKCVCGEKKRMCTCPDDMYALLGERVGGGEEGSTSSYKVANKRKYDVINSYERA